MHGDYSYVEGERKVPVHMGIRILVRVDGKVNGCAVICRECGDGGGLDYVAKVTWQRSRVLPTCSYCNETSRSSSRLQHRSYIGVWGLLRSSCIYFSKIAKGE
jgi:hypothetical protein